MNVNFLSATNFTSSTSANFCQNNFQVGIFAFQNASNNSTPPTFNGTNLTYYGQVGTNAGGVVFLWYALNVPNGSLTFVPNGLNNCNVYAFSNVNPTFTDVVRNDQQDLANGGISLTPTVNNGFLLFFQQAASGSGAITLTNGQGNKISLGQGATFTHASPGAGNTYTSTVSYSPSFPNYDGFGIALAPYVVTPTSTNQVLVVGAGGGWNTNQAGAGAGGVLYDSNHTLTPQTYTVTVGTGSSSANGGNSVFDTFTAYGGGIPGTAGGSGGGGFYANPTTYPGGAGTVGQGYAGGNGLTSSNGGGGGGGAASAGQNAGSGNHGGNSGDGIYNTISGTAVAYAGGGTGGGTNPGSPGIGGTAVDGSGAANTGSGAGGGFFFTGSGVGGSGIVIVAWPTANYGTASVTGGGTLTTFGSSTIATFTSSGTLTMTAGISLNNPLFFCGD